MGCEMGNVRVLMNKPVYLGQAILDLSKNFMYEFHYIYMLPEYGENLWLCYMDTDSFICNIKTDIFYEDIANDIDARSDMSSYSCSCPLPIGVNKNVIGLMKDELSRWIMTEFVALRLKLYTFKMLSGGRDKT